METVGYLPYLVGILLLIGLAFWLRRRSRPTTNRERNPNAQLMRLILALGNVKAYSLMHQAIMETYAQIKQSKVSAEEEQTQAEKDLALIRHDRDKAAEILRLEERLVLTREQLLAACKKRTTETEQTRALFLQLADELGLGFKPEEKEEGVAPTATDSAPAQS